MKPSSLASLIIDDVIDRAGRKHPPGSWRKESQNFHIYKGVRHILKFYLEKFNLRRPDGDPHLSHALCRLAMAIACKLNHEP